MTSVTIEDDARTRLMKVTAEASLLALAITLGRSEPGRYDEYLHNLEEFLDELPQEMRSVLGVVADELKYRVEGARYCH